MPSPERIALELLKDTVEENSGALPLNYVKFLSIEGSKVIVQDEITGEKIFLQPKIVVNAAGPWIDLVNDGFGEKSHFISGTKGSHLIIDHPQLRQAIGENELFFENKDGRIVLLFPIEDKVMVGSSDIRVDHPDGVVITDEEIEYFFGIGLESVSWNYSRAIPDCVHFFWRTPSAVYSKRSNGSDQPES